MMLSLGFNRYSGAHSEDERDHRPPVHVAEGEGERHRHASARLARTMV